jgi:anti-anti-sigma regulatory factor
MKFGHIQVARQDDVQIIRLVGDVRLNLCMAFDRYIRDVLGSVAFDNVLIDLSEADGIDSTTLGQLAKISIICKDRFHLVPTVYSPRESITRVLMSMGFDLVFHILEEPFSNETTFQDWVCDSVDEEQARQEIISAHKVLMNLNDANKSKFSELVETLECGRF